MEPFSLVNATSLDDEALLSGQFWGELRVFLAVAKAKSFNRAAEVLNTSQPTVSRQVKRLQDQMGSQLVVPTQNGVKLTAKGKALAQALSRLDQSLYAITNDLRAETEEAEGIVRVSITDGLNTFFVAPALADFNAEHPKVQLHLKSPTNLSSLRENRTDMMIGFRPVEGADVVCRELGTIHFIPVVAKSYIQQHGIPTRANAGSHAFLQSALFETPLWEPWNELVAQARTSTACDNSMAYGMLVKAGLGIGLLGSYTVVEPNAVPLDLGVKISVRLYALALAERLNARPVRLVFDWLSEIFGPANPWFQPEFRLRHPPNRFDAGIRLLFNV